MLKTVGITKTFVTGKVETPVLMGVDLHVPRGELCAVMGPSGSGKTTFLHILGLLERAGGGSYQLDGEEMLRLPSDALARVRNHKLGFVFQDFHLLPRATALKNVLLPFIYRDAYPPEAEERARQALDQVGLTHRLTHRPGELSGGERQRVAIARALVTGPEVILADEPTGNLDARSSLEIMSILQDLNAQGKTVILVTHDPAVGELCSRVVRLVYGRVESDRRVENSQSAVQLLQSSREVQP